MSCAAVAGLVSASIMAAIWLRHLAPSLLPQMPGADMPLPRSSASRFQVAIEWRSRILPRAGTARPAMSHENSQTVFDIKGVRKG